MSINKWIDEEDVAHTHTLKYYLAIKKEQNNAPLCSYMDLEIITLSEVNQRKTNIWYHLYLESKMITNELIYKIETDSQT